MLRNNLTSVFRDLSRVRTKPQNLVKAAAISLQQEKHVGTLGDAIQYIRFNYFFNARHHLDNDKWAKLFCVEGNVGVGKTPFGKEFAEKLELRHFPTATINYHILRQEGNVPDEQIEWDMNPDSATQKMMNMNMDHFCEKPDNWIHTARLQLCLMQNRYFQYCDALAHLLRTGQGTVMVRHFYSDGVHAEAQRRMGWIQKKVWKHYELSKLSADEFLLPPQVVIYLDAPAEQCYENIQAGKNVAEKRLSLEYLKRVEDAYKTVYFPKARERGVNIIEIDATKPVAVDEVIEDLDGRSSLLSSYNLWDRADDQLKRILWKCDDYPARLSKLRIYSPIEELWSNASIKEAMELEMDTAPWRYPKGLNSKLGDKNIFWKTI